MVLSLFFTTPALKIELMGKGAVHWEKEHYFVDNQNGSRRSSRGSMYFPRRLHVPQEETYIYQEKYLVGESKRKECFPCVLSPRVFLTSRLVYRIFY